MRDTESNLKKFAKIVERYPLLYFGSNFQQLGHLWETVASSVRIEIREECSVEEIKRKWKGMRNKFVNYARKLSAGGKLTKQRECDLFNSLAFLYPYAAERYTDVLKCPVPPLACLTDDNRNEKGKSKVKTTGKTSIRTYRNNKDTSAVEHHSVDEPYNLGQSARSDDLVQNTTSNDLKQCTRSGDSGQITQECTTSIKAEALWNDTEDPTSSKTSRKKYGNNKDASGVVRYSLSEPDNFVQKTRSDDLVHSARSDYLGQSTGSHELRQSTGSGDIGLSNDVKAEVLWDLTEDPTSSDSDNDVKPNIIESINFIKVDNFPDDMTESTSFDVQETEENIDLQFFRSILPDIGNFTPQEKRKFKMGVLKLIDEIEENRK